MARSDPPFRRDLPAPLCDTGRSRLEAATASGTFIFSVRTELKRLVINEFMADNDAMVQDPSGIRRLGGTVQRIGKRGKPWGSTSRQVGQSDEVALLERHSFNCRGGHLVVWCDEQETQPGSTQIQADVSGIYRSRGRRRVTVIDSSASERSRPTSPSALPDGSDSCSSSPTAGGPTCSQASNERSSSGLLARGVPQFRSTLKLHRVQALECILRGAEHPRPLGQKSMEFALTRQGRSHTQRWSE